ncbi:MAG: DUF4845 domain-containing protein [Thauera sp.]|jgi:hypothetical protein|nr:DUF4845 domain-containing protein [Thauera sp.]
MNHRNQQGLSLVSVLFVGVVLAFALVLGFRTVPAITEYMAVKRIVNALAEEGDAGVPVSKLRQSFGRRAQIDDVSSVTGTDLDISKEGNQTIVEVEYERVVPIAGNVSLLFEFQASSRAR